MRYIFCRESNALPHYLLKKLSVRGFIVKERYKCILSLFEQELWSKQFEVCQL